MTPERTAGSRRAPVAFAALLLLLVAAAVLHAVLRAQGHDPLDDLVLYDLGRWIGRTGLALLLVLYGRSALKRLLRREAPWRLAGDPARARGAAARLLALLNRTHPYAGAAAATLIFLHCYTISNFYRLLPLRIVLALLAWQALLGLLFKAPWTPPPLKRRTLLLHAQLLTGAALLVLAGIGHYLVLWG